VSARTQQSVLDEITAVRGQAAALRAQWPQVKALEALDGLLDAAAREVTAAWPLDDRAKAAIALGRFAAFNLDEVDDALCNACSRLDAALKA
jgi:hypothetical protein